MWTFKLIARISKLFAALLIMFLKNYFDDLTKLFLDTSAKLLFSCMSLFLTFIAC